MSWHLCFCVREHGGTTPVAVGWSGWKSLDATSIIKRWKCSFQTTPVSKVVRVGVIASDARDRTDARMLKSVVCTTGRMMIALAHAPTIAIVSLDWVRRWPVMRVSEQINCTTKQYSPSDSNVEHARHLWLGGVGPHPISNPQDRIGCQDDDDS